MITTSSKLRRLAATGAASALAAGALVATTTSPAGAAALETPYTCAFDFGPTEVQVRVDSPFLPTEAAAGFAMPELPVIVAVTLPETVVNGLRTSGVTEVSASADNLEVSLVKQSDGDTTWSPLDVHLLNVVMPPTDVPDSGTMTLDTPPLGSTEPPSATSAAFEAPRAGTYDVFLPQRFTIDAQRQNGEPLAENDVCTLSPGAENKLGEVKLTRNASETTAKVRNKPVNKGERARLGVKVTAPNEVPGGKVVVTKGERTLGKGRLGEKGKVRIKLDELKRGKHRVNVEYRGDGYTKPSTDKVRVRVRK